MCHFYGFVVRTKLCVYTVGTLKTIIITTSMVMIWKVLIFFFFRKACLKFFILKTLKFLFLLFSILKSEFNHLEQAFPMCC